MLNSVWIVGLRLIIGKTHVRSQLRGAEKEENLSFDLPYEKTGCEVGW